MVQKRYPVEETDLFHFWTNAEEQKKEEKPEFPWWKPVWENNGWVFKNAEGNYLDLSLLTKGKHLFPEMVEQFESARTYSLFSVFFVVWAQKLAYYKSVLVWNGAEKMMKQLYPEKNSKQIDRMCDDQVKDLFDILKEG